MDIVLPVAVFVITSAICAGLYQAALRKQSEHDREEARRRREEEQAALMGTIASGLAHEIRNPLSTVSLNLQLLKEDWASPISDREQKSARKVDVLLKEIGRLEGILNDFLRFAAGHKLRLERIDLNGLMTELLEFTSPEASRAGVKVHLEADARLKPVQVDANLIRQALLNLVLNAIQAMPEGGQLWVRTEAGAGSALVSIRDSGRGIPPDNLEKIFNLYFSTKPAGTGLGLPMAKKLVEEHGGTIRAESEPGRGACFTISLPTLDAQPPPIDDRTP